MTEAPILTEAEDLFVGFVSLLNDAKFAELEQAISPEEEERGGGKARLKVGEGTLEFEPDHARRLVEIAKRTRTHA